MYELRWCLVPDLQIFFILLLMFGVAKVPLFVRVIRNAFIGPIQLLATMFTILYVHHWIHLVVVVIAMPIIYDVRRGVAKGWG